MQTLPAPTLAQRRAQGDVICWSALPFRGMWRVGALRRSGEGLEVPPALDGFVTEAPDARDGGWNASFALPFTVAWWRDERGWRAVNGLGEPLAWTEGGALHTPEGTLSHPSSVRLWVAQGWEHRHISARAAQAEVLIAAEDDPAPMVDPAYDADLLSADTAWLEALGASLALALGVPFERLIEDR